MAPPDSDLNANLQSLDNLEPQVSKMEAEMHATPVAHRLCIDDDKSLLALLKSDNKCNNKILIIILYLLSDFGVVGIVFKLMVLLETLSFSDTLWKLCDVELRVLAKYISRTSGASVKEISHK